MILNWSEEKLWKSFAIRLSSNTLTHTHTHSNSYTYFYSVQLNLNWIEHALNCTESIWTNWATHWQCSVVRRRVFFVFLLFSVCLFTFFMVLKIQFHANENLIYKPFSVRTKIQKAKSQQNTDKANVNKQCATKTRREKESVRQTDRQRGREEEKKIYEK